MRGQFRSENSTKMTPDVFPKFPFLSYSKLQFDTLEEL